MTLPLLFLLSPSHTHHVNEHTLYPYAHWWSHQRSNESTFREVKLPDVVPQKMKNWHLFEGDFLGLGTEDGRWDIIVTLFFIDTASNIMSYVSLSSLSPYSPFPFLADLAILTELPASAYPPPPLPLR